MAKCNSTTSGPCSAKKTIKNTRTLKVRRAYYERTIADEDHAYGERTAHSFVPCLNLRGQWLAHAGFSINTPVKIRVMEGCLVVTAEGSTSS